MVWTEQMFGAHVDDVRHSRFFAPGRGEVLFFVPLKKSTQKKGGPEAWSPVKSTGDFPALLAHSGARKTRPTIRGSNSCSLFPLYAAMLGCTYGSQRQNQNQTQFRLP